MEAFGGWTRPQYCPRSNQLALAFTFAWERSCGRCDDTGGNGLWFYCGNKYQDYTSEKAQNEIGGSVGFENERKFDSCRQGYYINKIQINSEPYQGGDDDDTTLNNVRFWCKNSRSETEGSDQLYQLEEPGANMWGRWTSTKSCPLYYGAVGLELQMEGGQKRGDDTALGAIRIICGPINKFYGVVVTD